MLGLQCGYIYEKNVFKQRPRAEHLAAMNELPACYTKYAFQRHVLRSQNPEHRGGLPYNIRLPPLKVFSELPKGKTDPVPPPVGAVRLPAVATPVKQPALRPAPIWYMEGEGRFRDHDALRGPQSGRVLLCAKDAALKWSNAPRNGWTHGM
jgi:hypothetical protein